MKTLSLSVVAKLILAVLSLILVCLVLLVVRQYQEPGINPSPAATEAAQLEYAEWAANEKAKTDAESSIANVHRMRASIPRPGDRVSDETTEPASTGVPIVSSKSAFDDVPGVPGGAVGGGVPGSGGELVGSVILHYTPPPELVINFDQRCGRYNPEPVTTRHYVVGPNGGLANVFVFLRDAQPAPARTDVKPLLEQVRCQFEPYVMGVVVGQPFTIRNSDPEMLNIHATPKVNREFNMAQPTQGQVAERSFDKPELFVRLKSDLRAWMFAYICVLDHPYFAVTDTNGVFRLPSDIPPGNYLVVASHLKAGLLMRNHVTIRPGEIRSLRFDYKSEQVLPATLDLETVKRAPHGPL